LVLKIINLLVKYLKQETAKGPIPRVKLPPVITT